MNTQPIKLVQHRRLIMKLSTFVKMALCAGIVLGMYYGQPMRASAAEERATAVERTTVREFPYQVSLRSSSSTVASSDDVVVDGRIISDENFDSLQ